MECAVKLWLIGRVFFYVMTAVCLVCQPAEREVYDNSLQAFSGLTIFLIPFTSSAYARGTDKTPRWKRMDLPGVIILMGALICFILGLTQGPIDGWGSASFIAPFVLAFPLAIGFFFWGSYPP